MAPTVARKKDLEDDNAELRKTLAYLQTDLQQEFSAFKEELAKFKKEPSRSSEAISLEERFIAFEGKVFSEIASLTTRSDTLEERMDSLEQYSRRNCLLVHGIQEESKEDCIKTAVTLFRDKIKVPIDEWLSKMSPDYEDIEEEEGEEEDNAISAFG
ncbi:hypothetical protein J437_LFUL014526 [Ladona fulva]|uniref:Uncharacterized protein n=1 Tax=Ladona fulva TaxID=123851 RepID=A0A8K0NVL7_LADFU|nr:hypothetical protein J437_LFUL014526 [Ladona fulva]